MTSTPEKGLAPPSFPGFGSTGPKHSLWIRRQPWNGGALCNVGWSLPTQWVPSPSTPLPTPTLQREPQLSRVPGLT